MVDVKARDEQDRLFQVEVQMLVKPYLPQRIAYTGCDLYAAQLQAGQGYEALRPTYGIWLLAENLVRGDEDYAHEFRLQTTRSLALGDSGGIYLLELKKFRARRIETSEQIWLKFFKDGGKLNEKALPEWMANPEMRQAMSVLKRFSEKERDYHLYQSRMNYLREQSAMLADREEMERSMAELRQIAERERAALERERAAVERERAAKEEERAAKDSALAAREMERAAKEQERAAKEAALAEVERLQALLAGK